MKKPTTGIRKKPTPPTTRPVRIERRGTPALRRRRPGTRSFKTWAPPISSVAAASTAHPVADPTASAHTTIAAQARTAPGSTGTTTPTMPAAIARATRMIPRSLTFADGPKRSTLAGSSARPSPGALRLDQVVAVLHQVADRVVVGILVEGDGQPVTLVEV